MKRYVWAAVLLILCGACLSAQEGLRAEMNALTGADIEYRAEGHTFDDLERLRDAMEADEESPGGQVCAFAERRAVTLETERGIASVSVDALYLDGYAPVLWDAKIRSGALPVFGREAVCALDRAGAMALFGSIDIVGKTVFLGEAELTVCAVFELPDGFLTYGASPGRGVMLCPANLLDAGDRAIDGYAFRASPVSGKSVEDQAGGWFAAAGLQEPDLSENLGDGRAASALWIDLIRLLIAAILAREVIRLAFYLAEPRTASAIMIALAVAALGGALAVMIVPRPNIPAVYLPTRWSDLSYWRRLLQTLMEQQAARVQAGLLRSQLMRMALSRSTGALAAAAIALLLAAWRTLRRARSARGLHG